MKKFGVFLTVALIITAFGLIGCNTNDEPEQDMTTYGHLSDGSYKINPVTFKQDWYGATVTGDVIKFTDGGIYWLFPTSDFDINDYESLIVEYTTSGATIVDHLQITIKAITNEFVAIAGSGSNYGDDIAYAWLPGAGSSNTALGDGSFTVGATGGNLAGGKSFENFKTAGVVGIAFQASGSETIFSLKIRSMALKPITPPGDELIVSNPVFTSMWGDSATVAGDGWISWSGSGALIAYAFPAGYDAYDTIDISYDTHVVSGDGHNQIIVKRPDHETMSSLLGDATDGNAYPWIDGSGTLSYVLSQFDGCIGFQYNDAGNVYDIKITEIKFHN